MPREQTPDCVRTRLPAYREKSSLAWRLITSVVPCGMAPTGGTTKIVMNLMPMISPSGQ
jgi:hypothetical protein